MLLQCDASDVSCRSRLFVHVFSDCHERMRAREHALIIPYHLEHVSAFELCYLCVIERFIMLD